MFIYLLACQPNYVDFPQHGHQTSVTHWGITSIDSDFTFSEEELELMEKIKADMSSIGKIELHPKFDGKQMIMVIQPL